MNHRARITTSLLSAGFLFLFACGGGQSSSSRTELTVEKQNSDARDGAAEGGGASRSGSRADGGRAGVGSERGSSVNARVAMGVQTSSPISDDAQVVIDDGNGGAYLGHLVQRGDQNVPNTRPGDRRLVMEGGEGAYLSHFDASYQRVARVILEDLHSVDAIARHPATGELFIAGQEHFFPRSGKRSKLRLLHYRADGSKKSARLDKQLLARLPRRALGHRIEDLLVDAAGDLYLAMTVFRKRQKKERGGTGPVAEMYLCKMSTEGRIRWFAQLRTSDNWVGGEDAGHSQIAALAMSPGGQLVAAGSTGDHMDKNNQNRGGLDIFVVGLAADSGAPLWTQTFGTPGRDVAHDLTIAGDGTLIVVGSTTGQLFAAPRGADDAFILALDPQGAHRWSEQIGADRDDRFYTVTVTGTGAIIAVGETTGKLALERPATDTDSSGVDVLVAGYSPQGVRSWMLQLGTAVDDYPAGIAAASAGGAHLLFDTKGSFQGNPKDPTGAAAATPETPSKDLVLLRVRD